MVLRDEKLWGNIPVRAEVVRFKSTIENGEEKTLAYGTLILEGQAGKVIDLNPFVVSIDGITSEQIYVDSVAHFLPDRYHMAPDQTTVAVYWKIGHKINSKSPNQKFELQIQFRKE
jgi:hypothetical protein